MDPPNILSFPYIFQIPDAAPKSPLQETGRTSLLTKYRMYNKTEHDYRYLQVCKYPCDEAQTEMEDTTPFTKLCELPWAELGETCGQGNRSWAACSTLNSACTHLPGQEGGVEGEDRRECRCVHGTIPMTSGICLPAPNDLLPEEINVYMLSNTTSGTTVVIGSLNTSGIKMDASVQFSLYPKGSFLAEMPYDSKENQLVAITTAAIPQETKVYSFHVRAEMTYGYITVTDVAEVFVHVTRVFPEQAPVVGAFVVSGTREGSIVYDLTASLGTIEGLNPKLDNNNTLSLFTLDKQWVVCDRDVDLNDISSRADSVGEVVTLYVLTEQGEFILTLQVAVIANSYSTSVSEIASSLQVADFSSLANSFVVSLANGDFFSVDESTSTIRLQNNPDYENPQQRRFVFRLSLAHRNGRVPETTLPGVVDVLDANDERPSFERRDYRFILQSGALPGTVLGSLSVTDPDAAPTDFNFTIQEDIYWPYFKIDRKTGNLVLTGLVTEDMFNSTFTFHVSVNDGYQSSRVPASVKVTISNFQLTHGQALELRASVDEEQPAGTLVMNASIANYTGFQLVTSSDFFTIDHNTGVITTTKPIDYETDPTRINMSLIAYPIDETCKFEIVSNITVTILDINDNDPVFSEPAGYQTSLPEHSPIGTTVFMVQAEDRDSGQNANLTFTLAGPSAASFSVDRFSGVVTVADSLSLDRENSSVHQLYVIVNDGGDTLPVPQRRTNTTTLLVNLTDINDNSPVFPPTPYLVSVRENRDPEPILNVTASDQDVGVNGEIRYNLYEGGRGFFTINNSTGQIRTTQALDREQFQAFNVTILAYDRGSPQLIASTTVRVDVQDENDNAPVFEELNYLVNLDEGNSCASSSILTVKASDADAGQNADISYSIDTDLLLIDSTTGEIRCDVSGLDYENVTQRDFIVSVVARDQGSPPLNHTAFIRLIVRDLNDNSPEFVDAPYHVSLPTELFEAAGEGTPLYVVSVRDRDSEERGQVNFTLTPNSPQWAGLFRVDDKGVLRANKGLPPGPGVYILTLNAADGGHPMLTASTTLTLNVTTTGGLTPVSFSQSDFEFSYPETYCNSSSQIIGNLTLAPRTAALNPSVSLVTSDVPFRLDLNVTGGTIPLLCNGSLDKEENEKYDGIFAKVEANGWRNYASVTINVIDINDNSPIFTEKPASLVREVRENAANGTGVMNVTATDRDFGENGKVLFSLINTTSPFSIRKISPSIGEIYISGALDRETEAVYYLVVEARDNSTSPRSNTITVTIQIQDINDNPPQVTVSDTPTWTVSENTLSGTKLNGSVTVFDVDSGLNGTPGVVLEVLNRDECPFSLSEEKQEFKTQFGLHVNTTLNTTLDFEEVHSYTCLLEAKDRDGDSESLVTSVNVTITVTDVNDNPPEFVDVISTVNVSRAEAVSYVIVPSLNFTDRDEHPNDVVIFTMEADPSGYFFINPQTGEIRLKASLEDLKNETVILTVHATNTEEPNHKATATITVHVSDNNTAPIFSQTLYNVTVKEEAQPVGTLKTVLVRDYVNSQRVLCRNCTFAIESVESENKAAVDSYFTYSTHSLSDGGEFDVIQLEMIDRELTGNWIDIHLVATDDGTPPKSGRSKLRVNVEDIDDNLPAFPDGPIYWLTLNVSSCHPAEVLNIPTASDPDLAPNNTITYSLVQDMPVTPTILQVNSSTGEVTLDLSYICATQFGNVDNFPVQFKVTASDGVGSVDRGGVLVVVVGFIQTNVNPYPPVFLKRYYQKSLPYTSAVGTALSIIDFYATDEDENDVITYAIASGNFRDLLSINITTGEMRLDYVIDDSVPDQLNLTVVATDSGNFNPRFSQTGMAAVLVTITERRKDCYKQGEVDALSEQADQFKLYQGLFIALVVILVIVIVAAVVFLYKWRVTKTDQQMPYDTATSGRRPSYFPLADPMFHQSSGLVSQGKKDGRSADTSGLPPRLPRRRQDNYSAPQNEGEGDVDRDGYLTPSQGQPSSETMQGAEEEYIRRRANRPSYYQGQYISMLDAPPPDRAPSPHFGTRVAGRGRQPSTYLHPAADPYVHPARGQRDSEQPYTGLRAPGQQGTPPPTRQSDTYLHPTSSEAPDRRGRASDTYIHPVGDDIPPPPLPHSSSYNFGFSPDYPGATEPYGRRWDEDRWSFREQSPELVTPSDKDLRQGPASGRAPGQGERPSQPSNRNQNQPMRSADTPSDQRDGSGLAPMFRDAIPPMRADLSPPADYRPTGRRGNDRLNDVF